MCFSNIGYRAFLQPQGYGEETPQSLRLLPSLPAPISDAGSLAEALPIPPPAAPRRPARPRDIIRRGRPRGGGRFGLALDGEGYESEFFS